MESITSLKNIKEGDFKPDRPVYIKNITNHNIRLLGKLTKSADYTDCIFCPGWNPELIVELLDVPENSLQQGY